MRCPGCPAGPSVTCLGVSGFCPGEAEPTLFEKAANFVGTVGTQVLAGNPMAPPEVQEQRRAACFACPWHDHAADQCGKCGCTGMAWKRSMGTAECPDGRWPARKPNPCPRA